MLIVFYITIYTTFSANDFVNSKKSIIFVYAYMASTLKIAIINNKKSQQ
jgi:hypothetical protein